MIVMQPATTSFTDAARNGQSSNSFIPLCVPCLRGNEWAYVRECLDSGWVSSAGSYVDRFESRLAERVGAAYGVATVNGTAALHIALKVAGVQPDDEVLVSALTFIAPANAIRYVGAWPVFIDAEAAHWQMDPCRVEDFLLRDCVWRRGALHNRTTKRRVRAILPVHILGHPVDMDPLIRLARKFELPIIEDATETLGALYRGRPVGTLGDIACFSFNGNKLITTGGGGMIVTNREDLARSAKHLTTQAKQDEIEYVHDQIGYNYRLTNVQAAIGVAQLEQIDRYIASKRRTAERYQSGLRRLPGLQLMEEAPWATSVFWMYTIVVKQDAFGESSRDLMGYLAGEAIQTRPLWQPLHRSPAHAGNGAHCPVADMLHESALSLPCSAGLMSGEQDRVIEKIAAAARHPQQV
jgi:perosamine synthetase